MGPPSAGSGFGSIGGPGSALELEITRLAADRRSDAALAAIGRAVEGDARPV